MTMYGLKMAIYQLPFFWSSPNLHAASGYIWGHNFWTNQDLDPLSTSKWPSEPQFCERWTYIWRKKGQKGRTEVIYKGTFISKQSLSEQLYKSGRIRPTLSTGQFSNLSKNQCYISRWTLWHIKFGAVTKTEALGVISSFRGWISLYRASRQNVLFFSRYAE